jgi:hypothetical protein
MSSSADSSIPLVCMPAAIPPTERKGHFALAKQLFGEMATASRDLPSGYAFQFDAGALPAVARFIEYERRCCPFMTFELEVAPQSGPLWLRMTGPEGTRAVLDAELDLSTSCSCREGTTEPGGRATRGSKNCKAAK